MKSGAIHGNSRSEIQRAKKFFYASLALFCGVLLFWILSGLADPDAQGSEETVAVNRKAKSLKEIAQLLGEACGLSEHPSTLPPLERKWIMKYAHQEIDNHSRFIGLNESEKEPLAEAFFEGYARRYHDYYDPGEAHAAGFKHAKKVFSQISRSKEHSLNNFFIKHKAELTRTNAIDDKASWVLFRSAYKRGFQAGLKAAYYQENERTHARKTNHE